ncbi:hypothetical protein NLG97_g6231 [Lecanicillium saksenae]|uniref:Uncharacterized protein n=1 Tax=Lecanicillium saksenae TaxID=468837 RepID=A0ACC1QSL1_9HYPO|nr:hypothetical protein NLG97_g6231 [Lecanicillium saksenae]
MSEAISTPPRFTSRLHPRILAQDQIAELKEPFAKAYPNGIPKEYNMCRPPADEIPVKYIEDNLPLGFYTNPPSGAKAIFSTSSGERPFRYMQHILPRRQLHLWSKNEIQQNCNSIRKAHWEAMRTMSQPQCWDDLWHYFDAFDLYNHGAINLWNIINNLYAENTIIYVDVMKTCAVELGRWADQWLEMKGNADRLKGWEATKGPVIQTLDEQDWASLGSLDDDSIPLLSNALKHRRDHLFSSIPIKSADARDLLSSARSEGGLENWMTGQKTHPESGLQQPKKAEPVSGKAFQQPYTIVDGKYYYNPRVKSKGAVEALKASVEAASGHIIVAHGSKMSPPRYPRSSKTAPSKDTSLIKPSVDSQQTRPSSSDGSSTLTPPSTGTSASGSPRRNSDSTIRPSHFPSPKVDHGSVSQAGNLVTGDTTKAAPGPGSSKSPKKKAMLGPAFQPELVKDATCSPNRKAAEVDAGGVATGVDRKDKEMNDGQSCGTTATEFKNKSPYRGKRVENYSTQYNSPSSRAQLGGLNPTGKPFSKKWNSGFRRQENFPAMPESIQRDFSNPEMRTRVRFGVQSRFGPVEDAVHMPGTNPKPGPMNFLVRFVSEDSVLPALAFNNGRIEDHKIKLNISPVFRSKWVLSPSAYQMGNQTVSPESMYRVVKVAPQRRGELPFPQDQMMGRGGNVHRIPSGGPLFYNNQSFGQMESRAFGPTAHYAGRRQRHPMNAEGSFRGHQPFHAYNPQVQFHGLPVEAASYQPVTPLSGMPQSLNQMHYPLSEDSLQSRPVAEEALGVAHGTASSAGLSQGGAPDQENIKPRVSLPEKPVFLHPAVTEQRQQQGKVGQMSSDGLQLPPRPDKSPVRQARKKRHAAQLRAANFDNKEATNVASTITAESTVTAAVAATASATVPAAAKENEARRLSLFTADEIKDRKQAWDRIAVPLNSPRMHSTSEDGTQPTKPGHDRAKSLLVTKLPAETNTADIKSAVEVKEGASVPKSVEQETKFGSDAGHSTGAASASPKKSGKNRKKKNKQDAQSKQPAKKEYKL